MLWYPLRQRPVAATLGMATEDAQHKAPSVSTPH
jgi:hypothetical protein